MKKLLALLVCSLALYTSVSATVYTSSGNKSWTASGFPSWITASDTIMITGNDTLTLVNDIRIFGLVSIDSNCQITGSNVIKVESVGTLLVYGEINTSNEIHIDGEVYNYNQINVRNVHNDGYIYNESVIRCDSAQEFEHHGGEIEGCGTVLADFVRIYANTTVALNGDNAAYITCQNFCNTQELDTPNFNGQLTLTEFLDNSDTANCKVGGNSVLCFAGILPVDLVHFQVVAQQNEVNLQWVTSAEQDNRGFEIMRSLDNDYWEVIGFVQGAGTSVELNAYHFIDKLPYRSGTYYRLKFVETNGKQAFSETKYVQMNDQKGEIVVFPNPSNNEIHLIGYTSSVEDLQITSVHGQDCSDLVRFKQASEHAQIDLDISDLSAGVYFIGSAGRQLKFIKK